MLFLISFLCAISYSISTTKLQIKKHSSKFFEECFFHKHLSSSANMPKAVAAHIIISFYTVPLDYTSP